jgi:hypothetical protein
MNNNWIDNFSKLLYMFNTVEVNIQNILYSHDIVDQDFLVGILFSTDISMGKVKSKK